MKQETARRRNCRCVQRAMASDASCEANDTVVSDSDAIRVATRRASKSCLVSSSVCEALMTVCCNRAVNCGCLSTPAIFSELTSSLPSRVFTFVASLTTKSAAFSRALARAASACEPKRSFSHRSLASHALSANFPARPPTAAPAAINVSGSVMIFSRKTPLICPL